MLSSILNYYFPLVNGFSVTLTSEQNRDNENEYDYGYGSRGFRIRRHSINGKGIIDHTVTVAETKKQIDAGPLEALPVRLENALENPESTTGVGRCWALLIRGVEFMFTNIISIDLLITVFCLGDLLVSRIGMSIMYDGMQRLLTGCCDGWYSSIRS